MIKSISKKNKAPNSNDQNSGLFVSVYSYGIVAFAVLLALDIAKVSVKVRRTPPWVAELEYQLFMIFAALVNLEAKAPEEKAATKAPKTPNGRPTNVPPATAIFALFVYVLAKVFIAVLFVAKELTPPLTNLNKGRTYTR